MADKGKYVDEMISDAELECVSGGTYNETAADSKFLNIYGLCKKYSLNDIEISQGTEIEDAVKAAWSKVGVELEYNSGRVTIGEKNKYYINGNPVSRAEAYRHVLKLKGDQ